MNGMSLAPVLMLLFNRPDLTEGLIGQLRLARPDKLYIATDGPRAQVDGERERVSAVRKLVERIDWPCEKKWLIREENLGCGVAVSSALDWFFGEVDEGIILEDDCHPDPTFFEFASEMLQRYRNDEKVFSICGSRFFPPSLNCIEPYYFSKYPSIWGWATWRRAWEHYDFSMQVLSAEEWTVIVEEACEDPLERAYWMYFLDILLRGDADTWDFQFVFTQWRKRGLTVTPGVNLVKNEGFRPDATHTKIAMPMAQRPAGSLPGPYQEQPPVIDSALDLLLFYERIGQSPQFAIQLAASLGDGASEIKEQAARIQALEEDVADFRQRTQTLRAECERLRVKLAAIAARPWSPLLRRLVGRQP